MTAISVRVLGIVAVCAVLAAAQVPSAVLSGTVSAGGRGQAGVAVQAFRFETTQVVASTTTGADGTYQLSLPQGMYQVEFAASGFTKALRSGIVVLADATNELNVTMEATGPGTQAESLDDLRPGEIGVRLETRLGSIFLAIDAVHAPITSANFLKYIDGGFYTGGRFHRATRPDNYTPVLPNRPAMELIQGGINPARSQDAFPPIPLERTTVTGLKHVARTVSMARGTAADTATSDFFILLDDQPSLDAGGKRFDDAQGAAAFGRVYFGFGVVRKLQQQPVEGQNLTPPILILRASRVN